MTRRLRPALALVSGLAIACPSPRPPEVNPAKETTAASSMFEDLPARVEAAGAQRLVTVAEGYAAEGDRVGGFVTIDAGTCLLVYGRGSREVRDLDLFVFADEGAVLGSDEGGASDAAVIICPPLPARAWVGARVASGSGRVAIGAHLVEPRRGPAVAELAAARVPGSVSGRLESWPGLEARLSSHRARLGSRWDDVRRFAIQLDPRAPSISSVTVDPRTCIDVFAMPAEDVPAFELTADAPDGRVLARSSPDGRDRTLVLCSELGETLNLSLRPRAVGGEVALIVGRSPEGAAAELDSDTVVHRLTARGSAEDARAAFAERVDATWGKPTQLGKGSARVSSRTTLSVELPEGCSRVDVHAGEPLGAFDASLWTEDGALLAEASGGRTASLLACRAAKTKARLDVGATGREGPFVAERRVVPGTAALARSPLAASRIFERLRGADEPLPVDLERFTPIAIAKAKRAEHLVPLAAGECLEPVLALDGASGGFELRIVDVGSGVDVLSRGRFIATQRLCAASATSARVEVVTEVDAASGLVFLRKTTK